jgi:hypothetical protein
MNPLLLLLLYCDVDVNDDGSPMFFHIAI